MSRNTVLIATVIIIAVLAFLHQGIMVPRPHVIGPGSGLPHPRRAAGRAYNQGQRFHLAAIVLAI